MRLKRQTQFVRKIARRVQPPLQRRLKRLQDGRRLVGVARDQDIFRMLKEERPPLRIRPFQKDQRRGQLKDSSGHLLRQGLQRLAVQPSDGPAIHSLGAQAVIEADGGGVPIEHRPLEPAQILFNAAPGQRPQQRLARARSARVALRRARRPAARL